ncbi:MAG: DUF2802 domain-containing protein [Deltaproteobacteria bacterium]|nr:DUF2802 domain-containing protein [Deltaproteobacteria bacterium]
MELWVVVLSVVDIAIMGGIFFIMAGRRTKFADNLVKGSSESRSDASTALILSLKDEIAGVKRLYAELEKKKLDLDWNERALVEKNVRLDSLIRQADEGAKKIEALYVNQKSDEAYSKAVRMLKTGIPANEVIQNLGLLNGEVELISALNNYRV